MNPEATYVCRFVTWENEFSYAGGCLASVRWGGISLLELVHLVGTGSTCALGSCGPTHPSHPMISSTTSALRYGPLMFQLLSNFQQVYMYM